MDNLTIVIPFYNGHETIGKLLNSLPSSIPVVVVDDHSDIPPTLSQFKQVRVIRPSEKGYFSGAVNAGIEATDTDVLVLNQDVWLEGNKWLSLLSEKRTTHALIGDGVMGHPAWPKGYVQGTFMYMRRDAIDDVGLFTDYYPLWGVTCEWQLRIARAGFKVLPLSPVPGLMHVRGERPYGSAITQVLHDEPDRKREFIQTPPKVSVVISCYNYGRYLMDAVHSLIGGPTSLGVHPGQTFQSFEVIIVNDASRDNTRSIGKALANDWKGVRYIELPPAHHADGLPNHGTPAANNAGIREAYGKYIAILCADDMMEPWRLEGMVAALDANPHSMIYDDMMRFASGQRTSGLKMQDYDFERLLEQNHVHAGVLFPKQAWEETGGYPEAMRYGREDWAFNVALGIAGYCGVHLKRPGYLYRREEQGRSTRNTTPTWRQRFRQQLEALFPNIYAGERPMGCCGEGRSNPMAGKTNNPVVGDDGMVLVEYLGGNAGVQAWDFRNPTARYLFGGKHKIKYVDARHIDELLEKWDPVGQKPLFRLAEVVATSPANLDVDPGEAKIINNPVPVAGDGAHTAVITEPEPPATEPDLPADVKTAVTRMPDISLSIKALELDIENGDYTRAEIEAALEAEQAKDDTRSGAVKVLKKYLL